MSILSGVDLDGCTLYDEWYTDSLEWFVENTKTRGIDICTEAQRGRRGMEPSISFSGFYSQGDGLAFDCSINWPKFFETHEDFKDTFTTEYLLLVSNPSYIRMKMSRNTKHENQMSVESEDDYPDCVEYGFFAGADMTDDVPDLDIIGVEKYVTDVCEAEATRMFNDLEAEYDSECAYSKEQAIENVIDENKDELHKVICWLLLRGDTWKTHELRMEGVSDDVCFSDLNDLGLVEYISGAEWRVSPKGLELLK